MYKGDSMQYSRLKLLIGDRINNIFDKTVLVVGIGGVGGYAVEALVRAGIGKIIIVDKDIVDISNLNRQVISLHSNIGLPKVDVCEKRILDINPNCEVIKYKEFLTEENTINIFNTKIDYVVDACDTIAVKKELIRICTSKNIKLISSMGTGNKLDPTKLEIIDIRKTSYDPIAKILRKMVKDERIKGKVAVICSKEQPVKVEGKTIGSTSFVPATSGLMCASFIINDIVGE
jgi:tRNA A37 threonylcarbamoyladenosine dehydratase